MLLQPRNQKRQSPKKKKLMPLMVVWICKLHTQFLAFSLFLNHSYTQIGSVEEVEEEETTKIVEFNSFVIHCLK